MGFDLVRRRSTKLARGAFDPAGEERSARTGRGSPKKAARVLLCLLCVLALATPGIRRPSRTAAEGRPDGCRWLRVDLDQKVAPSKLAL
jgi:hypothetical protein